MACTLRSRKWSNLVGWCILLGKWNVYCRLWAQGMGCRKLRSQWRCIGDLFKWVQPKQPMHILTNTLVWLHYALFSIHKSKVILRPSEVQNTGEKTTYLPTDLLIKSFQICWISETKWLVSTLRLYDLYLYPRKFRKVRQDVGLEYP